MGRNPLECQQRRPRKADPAGAVESLLQPCFGRPVEGAVFVNRVEQHAGVDYHICLPLRVSRALEGFQRLRHVGHVHTQTEPGRALAEVLRPTWLRAQPGSSKSVDSFAEADVLLSPQPLGPREHVVVQVDSRPHAISVASLMCAV